MTPLWALLPGIQSGSRLRRSVLAWRIAERCSASRVRFAAANYAAPLTPARRSAAQELATGGATGNQRQRRFFVLLRREQMEVDKPS
jgi:hypothetical protein